MAKDNTPTSQPDIKSAAAEVTGDDRIKYVTGTLPTFTGNHPLDLSWLKLIS